MAKSKKPIKNLVRLRAGAGEFATSMSSDGVARRPTSTTPSSRWPGSRSVDSRGLRQMRPVDVRLRDVWTV